MDIFSFQTLQLGDIVYARRDGKSERVERFVVASAPYDFRNRFPLLRKVEVLDPETGHQIAVDFRDVQRKASRTLSRKLSLISFGFNALPNRFARKIH